MYIHLFIHRFTLRYAFFFLIHIKFQMILLQIMVLLIHLDTLSFSEFIGLNVRFNRTLAITFLLRSFINSLYQSSEIIPKFLCSNNLSFSLYFIIDRSYAFLFLSMNARKICILRNIFKHLILDFFLIIHLSNSFSFSSSILDSSSRDSKIFL